MSERTTIDSSTLLPLPAPGPDGPSRGDAEGSPGAQPAPAKKARRPRPTFDDGALTRTFKFPSKAYPRSSYYVTSTEIIIRIKKARKKWKLTVPKKRVVSYRTNRWFAKPRWVAIELTYTQAVKLGLAEARARVPEAPEADAPNTASPALPAIAGAEPTFATLAPLETEASGDVDVAEFQTDVGEHTADLGEQDSAEDFELAAAQDEPDADDLMPEQPELTTQDEPMPLRESVTIRTEENARVVPLVPQRPRPAAAPRRTFKHAIATLAAALTGFAIWAAFDAASLNRAPECERPAAHCTSPIVTGSIDPSGGPQLPASAPLEEPSVPAAEIDATARAELAAQNFPASVPAPVADEGPDNARPAGPSQDEVSRVAHMERDIAPPAPVVAAAIPAPEPPAAAVSVCDSLGEAGRSVAINFDPARALLDPAALAALDDFAAKLRTCPASTVTIEGHTDSDGHAAWNRTLSLMRAQAVQWRLIAAGIHPARLAAVGFGPTRPVVPNVSEKNKRDNRRVVLVVATQR